MTHEKVMSILHKYGQQHILEHLKSLAPAEHNAFITYLASFDLKLAFELYNSFSLSLHNSPIVSNMQPAEIITIPQTASQILKYNEAKQTGQNILKHGKVAVLIVAGGQGSRLGFDGPKGILPISPLQKKSLFQLFAEQVLAICSRYQTTIPFLIMTSKENNEQTTMFFDDNAYFGLNKNDVHFFSQEMIPSVTPEGKLLLQGRTEIYANPNGHGGSLKALSDSGLLDMLLGQGCTELFYCQVDNPLVKIADPVFLGYHAMKKAEASTKVVRRRSVTEKVGIYLLCNGKDAIVEYSDMDPEFMSALDNKGNILFWAGNTAIHAFSLSFVKRMTEHGFSLPFHCAKKRISLNGEGCDTISYRDVWKFETFIFDAIPLADVANCMEIERREEFSPIKNKDGEDSPDTARIAMIDRSLSWLKDAGISVSSGTTIEISPFFALDRDEISQRMKDFTAASIEVDTFLEG